MAATNGGLLFVLAECGPEVSETEFNGMFLTLPHPVRGLNNTSQSGMMESMRLLA